MKKIMFFFIFICSINFSFGQKNFTSKEEALNYIKESFSKYFVKTGYENSNSPEFNYEFTDTYLLITSKEKSMKKYNWFTLLPFNQISSVGSNNKFPRFKKSTYLMISSNCLCFKHGEGKKGFENASKFYKLEDAVVFPFNIIDENEIGKSLKLAFQIVSGIRKLD